MKPTWHILNTYESAHYIREFSLLDDCATIEHFSGGTLEELSRRLAECDIYIANLQYKITEEMLRRSPRIRMIATATTGTDHLPMSYMAAHGIAAITLRQNPELLKKITPTAELAWGLLLSLVRQLPAAFDAVKRGEWRREEFLGHQLNGKVLGIVGYGRLGKIMARYGWAFGLRVLAYDRELQKEVDPWVEIVTFEELLKVSDVVSIHIHLERFNVNFFDRAAFGMMKNGAILLNTSRGAIVDERALLEALESGKLSGAGLDVLTDEWGDMKEHPVVRYAQKHDNVLISPHCGGATYESQRLTFRDTLMRVRAGLAEMEEEFAETLCVGG